MTKSFFTVRDEAYTDMVGRKQKLLNRSSDAFHKGDLDTMKKAHSLAMKQDSRTRAKYPDEDRKRIMSGATQDYADREKKLGPGKVRDSVEYSEDTNVIDEGIMDFMSGTPAKPKSKLTLSAMREISRREDLKKNMNKVVRGQDEPQSASYRTVRSEEKKDDAPFDGPYKSNFKKPNNPNRTGMDSARALAQRSMDQANKKEPVQDLVRARKVNMGEAKDEQEYGYEGDMALNQLATLIRCADMIKELLKPDTDMPEWVQSKITLATDYIQTAADYMYSEMNEAKKMKGEDPCWDNYKMIGTKPKGGKQVPNCVPEEVEHIDEADSARLRMAKALQKAKDDRERSERNAEKVLNPNGKEVGEPKKVTENHLAQQAAIAIAKQKSGKYNKEGKRIKEDTITEEKPGLYANIHAKQRRIKNGSGEHMRKPGSKGAPTAQSFKDAQKTVKENIDADVNEGIARLISKSIKRVTTIKPTPQQKADIRLNK